MSSFRLMLKEGGGKGGEARGGLRVGKPVCVEELLQGLRPEGVELRTRLGHTGTLTVERAILKEERQALWLLRLDLL